MKDSTMWFGAHLNSQIFIRRVLRFGGAQLEKVEIVVEAVAAVLHGPQSFVGLILKGVDLCLELLQQFLLP
jgi:hypothetical protein